MSDIPAGTRRRTTLTALFGALVPGLWSGIERTARAMTRRSLLATAALILASGSKRPPPSDVQQININVAWDGDIKSPAPNGIVGGLSWSRGFATLATATPHGLIVGASISLCVNNRLGAGPFDSAKSAYLTNGGKAFAATVAGPSTFSYPLASDPGAMPPGTNYWIVFGLQSIAGAQAAAPKYSASGVCPATAPNASHIVLADANPACVGHAIQRNSDPLCYIIGFDPATKIALTAPIAGYAGAFSGVPAAGDSYVIYPSNFIFTIGERAPGSREWVFNIWNNQNAAISLTGDISATCGFKIRGKWMHNPAVPLGAPADNGSAVVIRNGDGVSGFAAFTSVLMVGCGVILEDIQIWESGDAGETGAIEYSRTEPFYDVGAVIINRCTIRAEYFTYQATALFSPLGNGLSAPVEIMNSAVVATIGGDNHLITRTCNLRFVTIVNTANAITATVGATPAGATTINVASMAGIIPGHGVSSGTALVGTLAYAVLIARASGNTISVPGNTIRTAIPNGSPILFGAPDFVSVMGGISRCSFTSNAFFGVAQPYNVEGWPPVSEAGNVCDSNPRAARGWTVASYVAAFKAASSAGAKGPVDLRPASGSPLIGAGKSDPDVIVDIFGRKRPNRPSAGAVEFAPA